MNISILRLATRSTRGVRYWSVPGFGNHAKFLPANLSMWKAQAVYWPARDDKGDMVRGARLDIHKAVVRSEIHKLIETCSKKGA